MTRKWCGSNKVFFTSKKRKISYGYYVALFLPAVVATIIRWSLSIYNMWYSLNTWREYTEFIFKITWFTPLLFVIANWLWYLLYWNPMSDNNKLLDSFRKWDKKNRLIVTYVSRWQNDVALRRAIAQSKKVLKRSSVNYVIEAITDIDIDLPPSVVHYLVPVSYRTSNNARYKARALQYWNVNRLNNVWTFKNTRIIHMDEESTLTDSVIAGIQEFITSEETRYSIGQWEIKYNWLNFLEQSKLITAIDSVRTWDDLWRFRLQYKLFNKPALGIHGSFFLVPADLERSIWFDLTPKWSVTEDAYFGMIAAQKWVKFWRVNGYIREQSPFTVWDIIKQRRRRFSWLLLLIFDSDVAFRVRWWLWLYMLLWAIAPLATIWMVINFLSFGSYLPLWMSIFFSVTFGMIESIYAIWLYRNLIDVNASFWLKMRLYIITFILLPVVAAIEWWAVVYAIVKPVKVFEVVKKN